MLSKLTLNNYRSHADTVIEFGTVTGITGLNNHGKTSIFRAIHMIVTNGDFRTKDIRHGTSKAHVEIEFKDGGKIRRDRTPSGQMLTVTTPDGVVHGPYKKPSDMTELVQSVSGFRPVKLTKGDTAEYIQLVSVDDPQNFLVGGVNPSTVLKRINKLAGGAGLEVTKQKLLTKVKLLNTEEEVAKSVHTKAELELSVLSAINFERLEQIKSEVLQLNKTLTGYGTYESMLARFKREFESLTPFEHLITQNELLNPIILQLDALVEKEQELADVLTFIRQGKREVEDLVTAIKQGVKLKPEFEKQIAELEEVVKQEAIQVALANEAAVQAKQIAKSSVCPTCKRPLEKNA